MTAEVRRVALGLLARREHSALELRRKLLQRGFPPALIDAVLDRLGRDDLLSEARYAEVYCHTRVDRGYGPVRIRRDLERKGVSPAVISAVLEDLDELWLERLADIHRKRFSAVLPTDAAERVRQTRFLHNRGFTLEQIRRLFRGA